MGQSNDTKKYSGLCRQLFLLKTVIYPGKHLYNIYNAHVNHNDDNHNRDNDRVTSQIGTPYQKYITTEHHFVVYR